MAMCQATRPYRMYAALMWELACLRWLFVRRWKSLVCVHIRYLGNGHLGFRPYGGSLLEGPKSKQKVLAPPLGASPRLGMPALRLESVGRRHAPSMARGG